VVGAGCTCCVGRIIPIISFFFQSCSRTSRSCSRGLDDGRSVSIRGGMSGGDYDGWSLCIVDGRPALSTMGLVYLLQRPAINKGLRGEGNNTLVARSRRSVGIPGGIVLFWCKGVAHSCRVLNATASRRSRAIVWRRHDELRIGAQPRKVSRRRRIEGTPRRKRLCKGAATSEVSKCVLSARGPRQIWSAGHDAEKTRQSVCGRMIAVPAPIVCMPQTQKGSASLCL